MSWQERPRIPKETVPTTTCCFTETTRCDKWAKAGRLYHCHSFQSCSHHLGSTAGRKSQPSSSGLNSTLSSWSVSKWCAFAAVRDHVKWFLIVAWCNNQIRGLTVTLQDSCLHGAPCLICGSPLLIFLHNTRWTSSSALTQNSVNKNRVRKAICIYCNRNF